MKKSLLILSLLVLTAGMVYADETVTVENLQTQTEVQTPIDKETINKDTVTGHRKFQDRSKYENKIKYDNSKKSDFKKYDRKKYPQIGKNYKNGNFHRQIPTPDTRVGHKPYRHNDYRRYNRPPQHINKHHSHNPKMSIHNVSNKNIKRINGKRAYYKKH